ncbi:MAG: diaminopimelate decarboxylase [Alphaproteobacteria bacterium]
MDAFDYRDGDLFAEDVPLARIAARVGTPAYVYSAGAMRASYRELTGALDGLNVTVCYAMKANDNLAVVRTFAELGAGADVVSGGELAGALAAGVPAGKIVFAGVGKTREEMAQAIEAGIWQFNVESEPELVALSEVAGARGAEAVVALRVNPDVDAKTHAKITTGKKENKFGISIERAHEVYRLAASLPGIRPEAVAMHIGSQLTQIEPYEHAFARMADLAKALISDGLPIRRLDLGGGIGIAYQGETPPSPQSYAEVVRRTVGGLGLELICEPGRSLVGNAGVLLAAVIYVKDEGKRFVILDAAMNDLIRPALYDAWHDIVPVRAPVPGAATSQADVVGPICESGDVLGLGRDLPPLDAGDLIAIRSAGAYSAVMASNYNSRPLAPEVLVDGDRFAVVRPRQSVAEMIGEAQQPEWES